ncbi:hypothetical protein Gotri_019091, partial [Gossypium trilobum]|nr:hypothetical protein [Gossypium trilobum]
LWLELPVDGSIVTRSVHAADWRDLKRNFGGLDEEPTEVQREQHVRAYILMIIGGLLMPNKQSIPPAPQDIKDLYHIDLRERTNENWPTFH